MFFLKFCFLGIFFRRYRRLLSGAAAHLLRTLRAHRPRPFYRPF